jgi:hypothetical protein
MNGVEARLLREYYVYSTGAEWRCVTASGCMPHCVYATGLHELARKAIVLSAEQGGCAKLCVCVVAQDVRFIAPLHRHPHVCAY